MNLEEKSHCNFHEDDGERHFDEEKAAFDEIQRLTEEYGNKMKKFVDYYGKHTELNMIMLQTGETNGHVMTNTCIIGRGKDLLKTMVMASHPQSPMAKELGYTVTKLVKDSYNAMSELNLNDKDGI
jgi:hypothetical protein